MSPRFLGTSRKMFRGEQFEKARKYAEKASHLNNLNATIAPASPSNKIFVSYVHICVINDITLENVVNITLPTISHEQHINSPLRRLVGTIFFDFFVWTNEPKANKSTILED